MSLPFATTAQLEKSFKETLNLLKEESDQIKKDIPAEVNKAIEEGKIVIPQTFVTLVLNQADVWTSDNDDFVGSNMPNVVLFIGDVPFFMGDDENFYTIPTSHASSQCFDYQNISEGDNVGNYVYGVSLGGTKLYKHELEIDGDFYYIISNRQSHYVVTDFSNILLVGKDLVSIGSISYGTSIIGISYDNQTHKISVVEYSGETGTIGETIVSDTVTEL